MGARVRPMQAFRTFTYLISSIDRGNLRIRIRTAHPVTGASRGFLLGDALPAVDGMGAD
jgi:hypothetical protein